MLRGGGVKEHGVHALAPWCRRISGKGQRDMQNDQMHTIIGWGTTALGILLLAAIFVPMVKILRRMGRSGWWSILAVTGPGMIVGLWLLAYCRWPAVKEIERSN